MLTQETFTVPPAMPNELLALNRLAGNLRWTWSPSTRSLLRTIDPELWKRSGGNPVHVLNRVSAQRLSELVTDQDFTARLEEEVAALEHYLSRDAWFQQAPQTRPEELEDRPRVAMFSTEFTLASSLEMTGGRWGLLAGDFLKGASDVGVPLVAVGLLYHEAATVSYLDEQGHQHETSVSLDPADLPIAPVDDGLGGQLKVRVTLPAGDVYVAVWQAMVGRVPLLLLDTHVEENPEELRRVTARVHPAEPEQRLAQNVILGVGGVRALASWCDVMDVPVPEAAHLSGASAAFAALERVRQRQNSGVDFEVALNQVRGTNVVTLENVHPEELERYELPLVERFLAAEGLEGFPARRVLIWGTEDDSECFTMEVFALRLSQRAYALGMESSEAACRTFAGLFPGFSPADVPIGAIAAGSHDASWLIDAARGLRETVATAAGPGAEERATSAIRAVRRTAREQLVTVVRRDLLRRLTNRGDSPTSLGWARRVLRSDALIIGLHIEDPTVEVLLARPQALRQLVSQESQPVNVVIVGAARAGDTHTHDVVRRVAQTITAQGLDDTVALVVSNAMAEVNAVAAGADLWLSRTAGIGALDSPAAHCRINGGLVLRPGAQNPGGWFLPVSAEQEDASRRDHDAEALYDVLLHDVCPAVTAEGLASWENLMAASLVSKKQHFSAIDMVAAVTNVFYRPLWRASETMADVNGVRGFVDWVRRIPNAFSSITVGRPLVAAAPAGAETYLTVEVDTPGLEEDDVRVEAIISNAAGLRRVVPMELGDLGVYEAYWISDLPGDYSVQVRVVPRHPFIAYPAELGVLATPQPATPAEAED